MSTRPQQWRSLGELADTPEFRAFLEAEFTTGADPQGVSRRRWMQLMGASLALAGVAGCRWEKEEMHTFAVRPDGRSPGVPQHFATAMELGGAARGLLATVVDGRPIKIEGNPKHPESLGAADVFAQALILEMYDPDRCTPVLERSGAAVAGERTWAQFAAFAGPHFAELLKKQGAGLAVVSEASSSPTFHALRTRLAKAAPEMHWCEYEPLSADNERSGARLAFGASVRTHFALDKARVIACLDADLLGAHPAAVSYNRAFAESRRVVDGQMSRLYVVESSCSNTGSVADHRLPMRSGDVAALAAALEVEVRALLGGGKPSTGATRFVKALAADLKKHAGASVIAVGPQQPPAVHAIAHRLNAALGNVGSTVVYSADPQPDRPSHFEALAALTSELNAGRVSTLVILGGNPIYDAPVDLKFAAALAHAPVRIRLGLYNDETARACTWFIPQAHALESWGDCRSYTGLYSVTQPLIEPLHGGKSAIDLLAFLRGQSQAKGQELVRETFRTLFPGDGADARWARTVHDGFLAGSAWPNVTPTLVSKDPPAASVALPSPWSGGDLEIVFQGDGALYDGRFANNGWLQELPRSLTKLTWDNAAILGPATAEKLGLKDQTVVRLTHQGRECELPVFIMPGHAPGSVAVALGFGRKAAGLVGGDLDRRVEPVGVDVYAIRTSQAPYVASGVTLAPTGKSHPLAVTQEHFAVDTVGLAARMKRIDVLARQATLEHYREHPDFAQHAVHHPPLESLWQEAKYEGRRWGMAIDLSRCTGCNACVVACQAENNVPVVGKARVLKGREMHWIRIDRYFEGSVDDPRVIHQPLACQQCEMAPCEQVCPVAATVHSSEGLNDMVYNRCVGTRYCANNCPYKVRRFNFFNYHKDLEEPRNEVLKMAQNPQVTVRSRGVMEKCTYCVQRIQAAKITAKNERREVRDGEIRTACQQTCPTQAIVFGDLADVQSRVRAAHGDSRAYALLAELNVKPRTAYLARIRNPNPELVDS